MDGLEGRDGRRSGLRRIAAAIAPASGVPPSARLCDLVCLGFAVWTVCAQAVVALGGSLRMLVGVFGLALLAGVASRVWRRPAAAAPTPLPPPPPARGRVRLLLQLGGLALGGIVALVFYHVDAFDVVGLWTAAVLLLGLAAVAFVVTEPPPLEEPARGLGLEVGLWLLALACVAVALAVHRPDIDDAFYLNVAVTAVDEPAAPLLVGDRLHDAAQLPLMLPVYRLHSWELWNGAVAWLTGIEVTRVFHLAATACAALLLPLAFARAFRWLAPRDWLWATLALVFVLLAVGDTHRWYGNFSFVRMWQGKALYLFVALPLVYAYAIEYAARPSTSAWWRLAAAQVAAVGFTSSALWGAPAAAWMALACVLRPRPPELLRFARGAATSAYVLGVGWLAKGSMQAAGHGPSPGRLVESYAGARLEEALGTVLDTGRLLGVGVALLLTCWAVCRRGLGQRFAIVLPLAVLLVLLDPHTSRWVVSHVTSSSYWRVMWALPIPMLMALCLVAPLGLATGGRARLAAGAACVAAAAVFAVTVPEHALLSSKNGGAGGVGIRLGWPDLKVPLDSWQLAGALSESVEPGSVVAAPPYVSVWVPTHHQHARPLAVRESYLRHYRDALGTREIQTRYMIGRFLAGASEHPQREWIFGQSLDRYDVQAVVVRQSPETPAAQRVLRRAGFVPRSVRDGHEIWVRGLR